MKGRRRAWRATGRSSTSISANARPTCSRVRLRGAEGAAPGMLEIENLSAGYGNQRVLHGVSLSVGEGQLVAVLGPNGHGKTTLLRCISGLVHPATGHIRLGGDEIDGLRIDEIVPRRRPCAAGRPALSGDDRARESADGRLSARPIGRRPSSGSTRSIACCPACASASTRSPTPSRAASGGCSRSAAAS